MYVCLAFTGIFPVNAQHVLKFNTDKKFKIVQFTDLHYISGDSRSDVALENMKEVLAVEKPDFVIFSGDVIFGKPAGKGMREVLDVVSGRRTPFAVTFGNHDDEQDMTREQLFDLIREIPGNLTSTVGGLTGVTNFILPVLSSESGKTAFLLYTFDSNAYSRIEGVKGYDYIYFDQIAWYKEKSRAFTKANGGVPVPAVAFFHIPLPEYNQAVANEDAILTGSRKEKACSPELNTGMFVAIKEMGDIMATFVGHDHDNDYAVSWYDVMLAYGRFSGGNNVYNNLKPNGARVIELTEGERGFRTWIRLRGGEVIHDIKYPDFFRKEKN
ncbi:MAG: metallophosphoesterase family protein [Tannerella sp.]|nr:metallophosphoesterase family protein [Tannerella sp.]